MDDESLKVKDKVELSLDGRQIASVVVGALVLLGVVFVLGLNVGRQLAVKQLEATRGDALAALDQPPPAPAVREDSLTFHDRLTRDRGPADAASVPPPIPVAAAPAAAAPSPATPTPLAAAEAEPKAPSAKGEAKPEAKPGAFAVQVAATTSRSEADKLAAKLKDYQPRVEAAEVAGKGRIYRVRLGAFASKPEAEKLLKTLAGRTGTKGMVVASRQG